MFGFGLPRRIGVPEIVIAVVSAGLSVAACGQAPAAPQRALPGLEFELALPTSARLGDSVVFTLRVTNSSGATVDLPLADVGDLAFSPVISRPDGSEVWRRDFGLSVGVVHHVRILPGQSQVFLAVWPLRDLQGRLVAPGEYRVRGVLKTESAVLVVPGEPASLTVLPPGS